METIKRTVALATLILGFGFAAEAGISAGANAFVGFGDVKLRAGAKACVGCYHALAEAEAGVGVSWRSRNRNRGYGRSYHRPKYKRSSYKPRRRARYKQPRTRYKAPARRSHYRGGGSDYGHTGWPGRQASQRYDHQRPTYQRPNYQYDFQPAGYCNSGKNWKFRCQARAQGYSSTFSLVIPLGGKQHGGGAVVCQSKDANGKVTTQSYPMQAQMKQFNLGVSKTCASAGYKSRLICDGDLVKKNGSAGTSQDAAKVLLMMSAGYTASQTKIGVQAGLGRLVQTEVGVKHTRLGDMNHASLGFKASLMPRNGCRVGVNLVEHSKFQINTTIPTRTCIALNMTRNQCHGSSYGGGHGRGGYQTANYSPRRRTYGTSSRNRYRQARDDYYYADDQHYPHYRPQSNPNIYVGFDAVY